MRQTKSRYMAPIKAVILTSLIGLSPLQAQTKDAESPPNGRPGACYIRNTAPAVIETVTEQILVKPETRGIDPNTGQSVILESAVYKTKTVQNIISGRKEDWIEVICVKNQSLVFVQTLQRALAARGHYRGSATGIMDDHTKRAIRKVQKPFGINSDEVTVDLAEHYGLITHRIFR